MRDFLPPIFNGTLREHYLLLFGIAGGIGVLCGLAGAWLGARLGSRRVLREVLEGLPSSRQQDLTNDQLLRLSQAVDVMSVEVERLAEGQRFAAKLLTDRAARVPSSDRPPGVITPH